MDTSDRYIKMCKAAKEVQKVATFDVRHDFYIYLNISSTLVKTIWLPRQDQLQEMVISNEDVADLLDTFYDWTCEESGLVVETDYSMEQLWLMFVMEKKYDKEWRDGTWKKAE